MKKFQLQIVSPSAVIFSQKVSEVIIPGTCGDFGVLSGHENLVAYNKTGLVDVREHSRNSTSGRFVVSKGIVQVQAHSCAILVNFATALENCGNPVEVSAKLKTLKEALNKASSPHQCEALQVEIDYLTHVLELCRKT